MSISIQIERFTKLSSTLRSFDLERNYKIKETVRKVVLLTVSFFYVFAGRSLAYCFGRIKTAPGLDLALK